MNGVQCCRWGGRWGSGCLSVANGGCDPNTVVASALSMGVGSGCLSVARVGHILGVRAIVLRAAC